MSKSEIVTLYGWQTTAWEIIWIWNIFKSKSASTLISCWSRILQKMFLFLLLDHPKTTFFLPVLFSILAFLPANTEKEVMKSAKKDLNHIQPSAMWFACERLENRGRFHLSSHTSCKCHIVFKEMGHGEIKYGCMCDETCCHSVL